MLTIALQGGRTPAPVSGSGPGSIAGAHNVLAKKKQLRPMAISGGEVAKINFRGPKRAGGAHLGAASGGGSGQGASRGTTLETRYVEDLQGAEYDAKRHPAVKNLATGVGAGGKAKTGERRAEPVGVPKKMADAVYIVERAPTVETGSGEYKEANVRLQKLLEETLGESKTASLKRKSRAFKTGETKTEKYVEELCGSGEYVEKLSVNLLAELVRLCPRKRELIEYFSSSKKKTSDADEIFRQLQQSDIVTSGGSRLSFLNALHTVCTGKIGKLAVEEIGHKNRLVQMINTMDAIQLETLAEMRDQLLAVNGRLSLVNVDALVGLRPLFYRLMHVPEDRVKDAKQLMIHGWREFTNTAETIRAKFNDEELFYIDLYVRLANNKLKSMGDRALVSGRHDFPSLDSAVASSSASHRPLPAAEAFAPALPSSASPSVTAAPPSAGRLWRRRGEQAPVEADHFPNLAAAFGVADRPSVAVETGAVVEEELKVKKRGKTVLLSTMQQTRRR
jgi:hypothetical protein